MTSQLYQHTFVPYFLFSKVIHLFSLINTLDSLLYVIFSIITSCVNEECNKFAYLYSNFWTAWYLTLIFFYI